MTARAFSFPYQANQFYPDPGPQPYDPGQSYSPSKARMTSLTLKPWPNVVPSINALASMAGIPRSRAPTALVNAYAPNPANYLFIGGFVGKSQG